MTLTLQDPTTQKHPRLDSADMGVGKLQALVYDILPSTIAVFSYAIGPRKLSANEHFFLLVLKQY